MNGDSTTSAPASPVAAPPVAASPAATPPIAAQKEGSAFLEDDNGNKSSMRLMSMIALVAAIIFGYLTVKAGGDVSAAAGAAGAAAATAVNGIYVTFSFLISAFAPKTIQKYIENVAPPSPPKG